MRKKHEFLKVAAVAVLSVGVFSAAFVGVNKLAYAAATSQKETLPPITMAADFQVAEAAPADYEQSSYTVFETPTKFEKVSGVMSPEEAAEIGAQYIWDVFGESIDGKLVQMEYNGYAGNVRQQWTGYVGDDRAAMEKVIQEGTPPYKFLFMLDAVTGMRIEISQNEGLMGMEAKTAEWEMWDEVKKETPANLDEYAAVVRKYAEKHFNATEVESVTFNHADIVFTHDGRGSMNGNRVLTPEQQAELDVYNEQANLIKRQLLQERQEGLEGQIQKKPAISYYDKALHFNATDSTGREARIIIAMESKELLSLTTFHNDLLPGVSEGY